MDLSSGYAYIIRQTDARGRTVREVYYDKDGQVASVKAGAAEVIREYDSANRLLKEEYFDETVTVEDDPALIDSKGNEIYDVPNSWLKIGRDKGV